MPLVKYSSWYFQCSSYARLGFFVLLFLFLTTSCQHKKTEAPGYSEAFKPVLAKTSILFGAGKVDEGLNYLDSSINQISKPTVDDRFRTYAFHFVYWKKIKGNNKNSLLYADSMLIQANKSITQGQYVSNYVEANMALGDAYFSMHKFNDAYQHYFKGYRVGKNNLNNRALADYSYRMGMILYKMDHFKLAAIYFEGCNRLSSNTGDRFADFYRKQEVLDNIGLSFKHNNQPDSAIYYFNNTLKYIDDNAALFKNKARMLEMAKAVVYGNKAEVLIALKDYTGATGLLKKSIATNLQKGNDKRDAQLSEIKLAGIYFDNNDDALLNNLLSSLRLQLDSVKNEDAKEDWYKLMSKYFLKKKQFERSLFYLQNYNTLKDSSAKNLNLLKESDVNQQLENFEKQYQIDSLKNNNKIQQVYLYVAIICALMAMVIVYMIHRNWKRSKFDIQVVNALNKQVNQQKLNLENALEELKGNSFEKDRILRTVAHDLRNPIGGIASLTLAMEDDDFTTEQRELINLIKETSNNSLELINEILEVTNNSTAKLNKELVDINSLLFKSVELLRFKAAEKSQQIKLELAEIPEELLISREKIWRVVSNLIGNAIKFSPKSSIIYVGSKDFKKEFEISIKDTGIGIPEDMKPKIFNMFTDAKRPGTAGEKSFGLGLSICKQIIENHGGKIWFDSKKGEGSTFYIRLPKQPAAKTTPSKTLRAKALTT